MVNFFRSKLGTIRNRVFSKVGSWSGYFLGCRIGTESVHPDPQPFSLNYDANGINFSSLDLQKEEKVHNWLTVPLKQSDKLAFLWVIVIKN